MKRPLWIAALSAGLVVVAGSTFLAAHGRTDPPAKDDPAVSTPADEAAQAAPEEASPPAAESAKPVESHKAPDPRAQMLETVGALAAAHYFQAYLNIGFLADGKAKGTYTEQDALHILRSVVSLLNSLDKRLAALEKAELSREDRQSVEQLRAASALLRQQAHELETSWKTGKDEDVARYESLRTNAWATISNLMGIPP